MSANALEGKSREELLALARSYKWWHSIDLGEMVTEGVTGRWALSERALDRVDFAGKKVLDIGCWDGIWSFEAEKRGAREVYSVDLVSMRSWSDQATYQLAHTLLGSKARYYPNLSVYDVGRLGIADFDVVIYCGIYYHLQDPLRAFAAIRDVMAEGGRIVVEGPVFDGTNRVFAEFSGRTWFADDPTNWWIPSLPCLREWLDCTFFDVEVEFSSNRNFAPPPATYPEAPATPPPAPVRPEGLWQRLKGALAAPVPDPPAAPPAAVIQDRISLVARATSPAERLMRRVGSRSLAPLAPGPGVNPEALARFQEAAAAYRRAEPWTQIRPDRVIELVCPSYSREPLFLTVLGDRTADRGLVIFLDRPGLSLSLQGALLGTTVTWPRFLAALFASTGSPSNDVEAVFNEGHDHRQPGNSLRRPAPAELSLLEGCLRAVPGFVERQKDAPKGREDAIVTVASGTLPMSLSWIVEGEREL